MMGCYVCHTGEFLSTVCSPCFNTEKARAEKAEREAESVAHGAKIEADTNAMLRAEVERLRARAHGGDSITYVERCDSCETFRQRMIAEKARAERAERERDEANAAIMNIRELHFKDGNLDAAVGGEGATAIAMTLVGFYKAQGGANYVEMQLADKNTGERYTVTVQRVAGKTPHELRTAAEARAEKLAAALREIADPEGRLGTERMSTIAARALAEIEGRGNESPRP